MQFAGDLNNVSLANLIQLSASGRLSGKLTVSDEPKAALISFEKGDIVHAEDENLRGREAILELFHWKNGKFSFVEDGLEGLTKSVDPTDSINSIEVLLREGQTYAEQRSLLEQLNIDGGTILCLKPDAKGVEDADAKSLMGFLDGRRQLAEAVQKAQLTKIASTAAVIKLLNEDLVQVATVAVPTKTSSISLPDWVTARLKQDNGDLSQAIVDMVIWVDRVKCWMYQADADMNVVLKAVAICQKRSENSQSTGDN